MKILLAVIFGLITATTAQAQTVLLSNTPIAGDQAFLGNLNPSIASSTAFASSRTNVYHTRFINPQNGNVDNVNRVYFFGCGVSGSWAVVQRSPVNQLNATGTINGIKNCTPTFYEDNKNTFLNWSYFDIPSETIGINDFIYYRTDSVDFRTTKPNGFFFNTGIAGFTSGAGNFFPDTAINLSNFSGGTGYFVLVNQFTSNLENPSVSLNGNFETRFINGTFAGTSTSLALNIDYFLNLVEFTPNNRPDAININILENGLFSDQQVYGAQKIILPLLQGNASKTIPIDYDFPDGSYLANINFWNINTNFLTFSATGLSISFDIVGGAVQNIEVDQFDGTDLANQTAVQECSFTSISGCFINFFNSLIASITPSSQSFMQFAELWQQIQNKPPFGYISSVIAVFTDLDANAAPALDFDSLPFIGAIFDPFNLLLASLLWFFYLVWLYKRLMKLEI